VNPVVLRKVKRSGAYGRWPAYEIASDPHGHWLYSPKGTVYRGHPRVGEAVDWEIGRPPGASEGASELHLVPRGRWWVAKWYVSEGLRWISVDICEPPVLADGEWSFVDLELDPFWCEDGSVGVGDQDEFDEAVVSGALGPSLAAAARSAAAEILERLSMGVEPFAEVGWRYFDGDATSQLPPIRTLPPRGSADAGPAESELNPTPAGVSPGQVR